MRSGTELEAQLAVIHGLRLVVDPLLVLLVELELQGTDTVLLGRCGRLFGVDVRAERVILEVEPADVIVRADRFIGRGRRRGRGRA